MTVADLLGGEQGELREAVHEATRGVTEKYGRKYWLDCAREDRFPDDMWQAMVDQGLVTSLAAAFALVSVGLALRRTAPPAPAPVGPVERHPQAWLSLG